MSEKLNKCRPKWNRRRLLTWAGTIPVLGSIPWLAGCMGGGRASHTGPVTDHFDGTRFFNPGGAEPRSILEVARWQLGRGGEAWPDALPSPFPPDRPPRRVAGPDLRVSFVGHATFLLQGAGLNILTDPVWSERASPFAFAGPRLNPWHGVMGPANLPPAIATRLSEEIGAILRRPDLVERLAGMGVLADPGTPEAFRALMEGEVLRFRELVERVGIAAP